MEPASRRDRRGATKIAKDRGPLPIPPLGLGSYLWQNRQSMSPVKEEGVEEVVTFLLAIFRVDRKGGREIGVNLGAEERGIDFLVSDSKTQVAVKGPAIFFLGR
jgi:hypothetical protein